MSRTDPARTCRPLRILRLLLSPLYDGALAAEHRADLAKSGLIEETIRRQRLMSVPPDLIARFLGFPEAALRDVRSAMLLPYADPAGGWLDHSRVKLFPALRDREGHSVKYLQPRGSAPRLFFPIAALPAVLDGAARLWLVEGEKKSLAAAQLGLPTLGFAGVEAWHVKSSRDLLPDFDAIPLDGRLVELVPDGDEATNPAVRHGAERFATALRARGARVRLVKLPAAGRVAA